MRRVKKPEKEIPLEQWCREKAEKHSLFLVKWVSPGNKGVPDRILLGNQSVVFIEFKATTGKLSTLQKVWRDRLTRLRLRYHVIRSREEFLTLLSNTVR